MDRNRHQETIAQLFSWMAGGMVGGVTLSLVSSSIDVFSFEFWILFGLVAMVGYAFSFLHTQVKPEDNSIESDIEEIKSELSELKSGHSELPRRSLGENPEPEKDSEEKATDKEKNEVETEK